MPQDPKTRVARKFRAAMTEERMKVLLAKLRKGADSSVTLKQLIEALHYLGGWKVEPFVGLVKMLGYGQSELLREVDNSPEGSQRLWQSVKQDEVPTLPAHPSAGQRYIMDLSDPKPSSEGVYEFTYREWRAAEGFLITSPNGKDFEALPSHYEVRKMRAELLKRSLWGVPNLKEWLRKGTDFVAQR